MPVMRAPGKIAALPVTARVQAREKTNHCTVPKCCMNRALGWAGGWWGGGWWARWSQKSHLCAFFPSWGTLSFRRTVWKEQEGQPISQPTGDIFEGLQLCSSHRGFTTAYAVRQSRLGREIQKYSPHSCLLHEPEPELCMCVCEKSIQNWVRRGPTFWGRSECLVFSSALSWNNG